MNYFEKMRSLARDVLKYSYSPYSNFPVSCVILTKNNQLFSGVNMENASYPEGICAEGTALGSMISAGEREISEVVICSQAKFLCFPCGGCRQRLSEFSSQATLVHICHAEKEDLYTTTMGELLPHSFSQKSMEE